jgi:hypothetical protein
MSNLSPGARASWRDFWRSGPRTPRQAADAALARIEAADLSSDGDVDEVDSYDYMLLESGTDPLTVQQAKAERVERGHNERVRRRRAERTRRGE